MREQTIERYEIATCENLIDRADKLGLSGAVERFEQTLAEERGCAEHAEDIRL